MIQITIDSGNLRNRIEQLGRLSDSPRPILQAATGSVVKLLRAHFTKRAEVPNRMGGKRTNFWKDVNRSAKIGEVTDRSGTVVIGDYRFAQKVYGGKITAGKSISSATGKPTKYLAIPARTEAYGKRPAAFKGVELHLVQCGPRGGAALVVKTAAKAKSSFIDMVYYWLVRSVTQKPDPKALPPRDAIEKAAAAGAESYLRGAVQRDQPHPPTTPIA
jgi:hypothetical protein